MKENENSYNNNMSELDEEKVNYQEILFKYIIHWPWFIASVLACLIGAWVYLHFQTPVYQVSASIMIKNDKKNGGGNTADLESLGLGGVITSTQSIDNEIEVLRSKTILKEVVNNLELYITYYDEDEFPKKELYKTSPVIVNLTAQEADKLPNVALVDMKLSPEQVDMIIIDNAGEKQDINVQKEISKAIRRREKKYITQIEEAKELLETVDKIWD